LRKFIAGVVVAGTLLAPIAAAAPALAGTVPQSTTGVGQSITGVERSTTGVERSPDTANWGYYKTFDECQNQGYYLIHNFPDKWKGFQCYRDGTVLTPWGLYVYP
jgi:hypothetical protein